MSKNTFIGILGVAGILMLIGFFLPWGKAQDATLMGFENSYARLTFIGGWITVIGAMNGFDLFNSRKIEDLKPITDIGLGLVGGILSLIGLLGFSYQKNPVFSSGWGVYLVIIGVILTFLSAIMIYFIEGEKLPGRRPREKSGGL